MRFCITCGSPLEGKPSKPSMPAPVPAPAAPQPTPAPAAQPPTPVAHTPAPAPSPGIAAPGPAIAPVPVVGLGAPAPQAATRACKRCKGVCDANAQFCRFCGAPLADGKDTEPIPVMASPSQAAPAAPPAASPPAAATPVPAAASPAPAATTPRLDATLISGPPGGMDATTPAPTPAEEHEKTKVIQAYQGEVAPAGRLVVIAKDGGEGPSFPILDQLDIGRADGEATFAEDRYLAPRHARIVRVGDTLRVRDLGSPNGIYLRLRKKGAGATEYAGEAPLADQDLILIGQQVLRFEIVKDAEEGFGAASEHGTLVFGTPAAPRYARLCQRTTEGVARDVYHLRKAETVLGRESGDIVFTEDPFLSRRHAAVRMDTPESFALVDLDSSNGTFIRIRGEVAVQDGDELRMGQELFRVDLKSLGGRAAMPSTSDAARAPA